MENFEKLLGKNNPLLKSINDKGFEKPSEIQEKTIPKILKGKDLIAIASTGSGKTLAFTSGLINNIERKKGIQGLIMTPTRELAEQVAKEISMLSKYKNLTVISIYGGESMERQVRQIPKAEIVVGTPGRILDHLERRTLSFSKINTLVLDEADRMFDMGFREDVRKIITKTPAQKQTLLFSATMSPDVTYFGEKYMNKPEEITAEAHVDPKKLTQIFYDVDNSVKYSLLVELLKKEKSKLVIIFCNTRRNVDFVSNNLQMEKIESIPLHGGYSQDKRNNVMKKFHSNKAHVLVATDVAARGLHIDGISHVYNYDLPANAKEYIHRIGRTARAGKEGKVINLLSSRDYENFRNILQEDLPIKQEKAPYVNKITPRWMPERDSRSQDNGRFGSRDNRGPRSNNRGSSRDSRDSSRSRSPSRDNRNPSRSNSRIPQRSYSRPRR